jgi:hypothetical protein
MTPRHRSRTNNPQIDKMRIPISENRWSHIVVCGKYLAGADVSECSSDGGGEYHAIAEPFSSASPDTRLIIWFKPKAGGGMRGGETDSLTFSIDNGATTTPTNPIDVVYDDSGS